MSSNGINIVSYFFLFTLAEKASEQDKQSEANSYFFSFTTY